MKKYYYNITCDVFKKGEIKLYLTEVEVAIFVKHLTLVGLEADFELCTKPVGHYLDYGNGFIEY